MVATTTLSVYRKVLDAERAQARSDAARELSIAITHLEDAELRIARANVLASRQHRSDAAQALDKATDQIAEQTLEPEKED